MIKSDISAALFTLVENVIDNYPIFNEFQENEVVILKHLYLKTSRTIIKYDKGIKGTSGKSEYYIRNQYFWRDFGAYYQRLSKRFPILSECYNQIKAEYGFPDERVIPILNELFQLLLFDSELKIDKIKAIEIVSVLINDLNKIAPLWSIKLYVDGVWLDDELLEISKDIKIRRPLDSDFDFNQTANFVNVIEFQPLESCSAIIEITNKFENERSINNHVEKIITALRIFGLGSIEIKGCEYKPNSILIRKPTISFPAFFSKFTYGLSKTDIVDLAQFLDFFMEFYPDEENSKSKHEINFVFIGIDRYFDAILKSASAEKRITSAITALEALLLKANERSELSHRLAQRIAYLSKFFNEHPIKMYN